MSAETVRSGRSLPRHLPRASVTLKVRYSETDQMGVVYHANYLSWFHEARDQLLADLGVDIRAAERDGYLLPVVDVHCRYVYPARFGDRVTITAIPEPAAVARLVVHYQVHRIPSRRLLAEGSTVNVLTNREGRLLLRVPDSLRPLADGLVPARDREKHRHG